MAPRDRPTAVPRVNHAPLGTDGGSTVVSRLQQSKLFREYQRAFEATTGLPLVLRQPGSFRPPLQDSKRMNPFCALMAQSNHTCAACLRLQQRVEEEATLGAKTIRCYAGLSESAVPVRVGTMVLGYLQTGQVFLRAPSKKQFRAVARAAAGNGAGGNQPELESAYFQTPVIAPAQYESIIRLLTIFAEHLAIVSNQMLIREATTESPVIARARAFIAEHQTEDLGLCDVARAMHMNAAYFCRLFHQGTGLTFTEYVTRGRIESVKLMLLNVHLRVSEVAFAAGFQSMSQFNRVFRRVAGEAPSRYRERVHGPNGKTVRPAALVPAA